MTDAFTTSAALLARLHHAQASLYSGGSDAALREVLHPDIEWHVPGSNAIAGHYVGTDAVVAYMRRRRDIAAGTFHMHPGELLVGDGSHIAALVDGSAVIGGVEVQWSTLGLYRVLDGRIRECRLLAFDQEQFDRIWS
jgi:ketosteroid isomerase-like protein